MGQDELLAMITHGAERILSEKYNASAAVESIEEILKRGEEKTKELNAKYANLGMEDLQKFSSDQISAYQWEGEDYRSKSKLFGLLRKSEPSKRERKLNSYSLLTSKNKAIPVKAPKPPNQRSIYEYQLYPPALSELLEKETLFYRKSIGYQIPKEEDEDEKQRLHREAEQQKIDDAMELTEEEQLEKDRMMAEGFPNWTKKDFLSFIRGCEKFGRKSIENIAMEVEGKSFAEVEEYSKAFWSRYTDIPDYEKIIHSIEKGEAKIRKTAEIQKLLTRKINSQSIEDLTINYSGHTKGKNHFSLEEDKFLLICLESIGYGREDLYDRIKEQIRRCPLFKMDWFFRTRSAQELAKRCQVLVSILEKESKDMDEQMSIKRKKRMVAAEEQTKKTKSPKKSRKTE